MAKDNRKEALDVSKENILKSNNVIFNSDTGKYDCTSNLNKETLKYFVSENKDGFIINFGEVTGNFICSNLGLTSLKGAPQYVGGSFWCKDNDLMSLEGAPKEVGKDFECSRNQLITLEGAPKKVGRDFYCNANRLVSLIGAPEEVGSLFFCCSNKLTSLKGAPKIVGDDFWCVDNPKLHSLEGIGKVKRRIVADLDGYRY